MNVLSGIYLPESGTIKIKNQNFIFIKEIINIIKVNTANFVKWLFVWNKTLPPSVEYIVARLINPNNKIQIKSITFIESPIKFKSLSE